MSISLKRPVKTGVAAAGLTVALSALVPATASADIVDTALGMVPAGEISCEQAEQYWTTESEYESYAAQAQAVAVAHPRGGEINDALARIDEAANRCGLKGGGEAVATGNGGATTGTPANHGAGGGEIAAPVSNVAVDNGGGNDGGQGETPADTDGNTADNAAAVEDGESAGHVDQAITGEVFTVPVPEGTPTMSIEIVEGITIIAPDVEKIAEEQAVELIAGFSN